MSSIFQQVRPKDGHWHLIELEGISNTLGTRIRSNHNNEFFTNQYSVDLNKFIDTMRKNHYKIISANTHVVPAGMNINRVHYCTEIKYE